MIDSRTRYVHSTNLESFRYSNLLNIVAGGVESGAFSPSFFGRMQNLNENWAEGNIQNINTIKPGTIKSNLCLITETRGSRAIDINILKWIKC